MQRTFSIDVTLTDEAVSSIDAAVAEDIPTSRKIGSVATYLLSELSKGGIMLDSATAGRIKQAASGDVSPEQIVQAFEHAHGRDGGHIYGEWKIDPIYEKHLSDMARQNGLTVQQAVQYILDDMLFRMLQDWRVDLGVAQLSFTHQQIKDLEVEIGKPGITGSDVVDYIKAIGSVPGIE